MAEKNSENSKMTHKLGIKTQKTGKKTQEMADKNSENVQKRENIEALYESLKSQMKIGKLFANPPC